METKHTPGPWRYNDLGPEVKNYPLVADDPTCVGHIEKYPSVPPPFATDYDYRFVVGQANARLIAAAPETKRQRDALLEVCKAAMIAMQNLCQALDDEPADGMIEYEQCKTAIALAEREK